MQSSFVISLDFELMWGVRDKRHINSYGKHILGARAVIPRMLRAFEDHGIRATWATVGLLFAECKDQIMACLPKTLPDYDKPELSPYECITSGIGKNEKDDPYHYGKSLIERIKAAAGQEIATHTFSHFYCLEKGSDIGSFKADIEAAKKIAADSDVHIKSIVFPRNQIHSKYIKAAQELGILGYRGNHNSLLYRPRKNEEQGLLIRGGRLLDSVIPVNGYHGYLMAPATSEQPINIPASRLLRRTSVGWGANCLANFQLNRVKSEMTHAARKGLMYHLWWHPHNFGADPDLNLNILQEVIRHFRLLHSQYGMESKNMADFIANRLSSPL